MNALMISCLAVAVAGLCLFSQVSAHSYHLGTCPVVEPMHDFNMDRLLGKWYVQQKTSTGSRCLTYNFTAMDEPYTYQIEQVSEHPVLGLASIDNQYHYTGVITVPHRDVPAKMTVRFPLSVAGSASYTVFSTDYDTYAGIFTCQKLAFANRQSASILSRTKVLDKMFVDKVRSRLSSFGVDPFELSVIDQSDCQKPENGVNIQVDDDTFSPKNIGNAVKKVGAKIGDGVEYAANGAKKIYNTLSSSKTDGATAEETRRSSIVSDRQREELINNQNKDDAEWLP